MPGAVQRRTLLDMTETGTAAGRSPLRSVALPTEHGGWSLTLEPVILGLLVAPSVAGFALGGAALVAFIARTPLKVVLVDRWRGRWLARSSLAARVAGVEIAILGTLAAVAIVTADAPFWWPLLLAAPPIGVELWHDMRSQSRRLVPELAGAIGIGSIAAAVALAGGAADSVAAGLWLVIAARSIAAVPFVRVQLLRAKARAHFVWHSDLAQVVAVAMGVTGWLTDLVPPAAVAALAILAIFDLVAVRRAPQPAPIIGAQQVVLGLTVILITALGVRAP